MKMTAIGRAVLEAREGVRLTAYRDSVGVWTIGVGHTAACGAPIPKAGLTITAAEADAAFARDLSAFETALTKAIKVPVADHEFDALGSFAFNVGAGGAAGSTAVRLLNAGDRTGAAKALMLWNKPAAIISRREAERDQFLTSYDLAMPRATSSGPRVKAPAPAPAPLPELPNKPVTAAPSPAVAPKPPDPPTPAIIAKSAPPAPAGFSLPAAPIAPAKPPSLWDRIAAAITNMNRGA